jgi:septal ring factor EnvC (AmiA/AmiB activator)
MKYVSVAVYVCRLLDEERQHHKDIVSNNEVIDDLRAALDVERSNALELESRFKQEQERSKQVRTELENSNLQLNVQQTLAAELQQKVDELTVC